MKTYLDNGQVQVDEDDLFELMFSQKPFSAVKWPDTDEFAQLKANLEKYYLEKPTWSGNNEPNHTKRSNTWLVPETVFELDITEHLFSLCKTEKEQIRVIQELELFLERDLIKILQLFKYIIDVMDSNNIVYGVGRGSATHSYCLFLLGVHHIDSLRFNLNIREFLK